MHQAAVMDVPTCIAEVAISLHKSPYKVMRRVSCESKRGVLFLQEIVRFHEKQVAQEIVAGVSGVTQVVNEIEVDCRLGHS